MNTGNRDYSFDAFFPTWANMLDDAILGEVGCSRSDAESSAIEFLSRVLLPSQYKSDIEFAAFRKKLREPFPVFQIDEQTRGRLNRAASIVMGKTAKGLSDDTTICRHCGASRPQK